MKLKPFDPSVHDGVDVDVEAVRRPLVLEIRYDVTGAIDGFVFPERVPSPVRRDELWKTTCFEGFIAPDGGDGYLEFNFSPSGDWQAYRLTKYREGIAPFDQVRSVEIRTSSLRNRFRMTAIVHLLDECLGSPCDGNASVTVILADGGNKQSFWAPGHGREEADFHHRGGFLMKV